MTMSSHIKKKKTKNANSYHLEISFQKFLIWKYKGKARFGIRILQ